MHSTNAPKTKSLWFKDVLNGFIVWVVAFAIYMIPAFIIAIPMGFNLGPKLKDNAEVGKLIGQAVSEMYRTNPYLLPGYTVILAVLIFWRSRVTSRIVPNRSSIHGAVIAAIPVAISLWQIVIWRVGFVSIISIIIFLVAGIAGGLKRTSISVAE
jgi:hypothetical protein